MLDNMRFWDETASRLTERMRALLVDVRDPVQRRKAVALVGQTLEARERSQECARDVAPFIHPRLAAVALTNVGGTKIVIEGGLPPVFDEAPEPAQLTKD